MLQEIRPQQLGPMLKKGWSRNRWLTFFGVSMVVTLVAVIPLIFLDSREITGVRGWIKPAKFALSGAIYAFTFLWMLSMVKGHRRLVGAVSIVVTIMFVVEMVVIIMQVVRGTTSHFNAETPFDTTMFSIMGASITVFWLMTFVAAFLLMRQRMENKALAAGIRAGLILSLIGMAIAFLMVIPTDSQIAADQAGQDLGVEGAHTIGLDDGGPGLPLVDWSTQGGDLRVPHFFGLHSLQILPLVGWLVGQRREKLGTRRSVALVTVAAFSYLGFMGILTWQALRGQSVVSPDGLTLAGFGILGLATAALGVVALRLPQSKRPTG